MKDGKKYTRKSIPFQVALIETIEQGFNMMNKDDDYINGLWYASFCNSEEIARILHPKTAKDYLLKKRADIVADHARYVRVYIDKRQAFGYKSFEETFSDNHYLKFLSRLSDEDKKACSSLAYGDIFYKDFNAYTESTDFGTIVYLNNSLHYFMYFLNLAILEFDEEVPFDVRFNALRIAVRIALQHESMDFDVDPRGIVPKNISDYIENLVVLEKQFIAGHEFSHYLCGHLKDTIVQKIYTFKDAFKSEKIYNIKQQNEFEADLSSILRPNYSDDEKKSIINAALIFFASLDMVEYVDKLMNPIEIGFKSHPSAIDRFERILTKFSCMSLIENDWPKDLLETINFYKKILKDDLDNNLELYDFYGSCYLAEPNTKWRGKALIDRVDY